MKRIILIVYILFAQIYYASGQKEIFIKIEENDLPVSVQLTKEDAMGAYKLTYVNRHKDSKNLHVLSNNNKKLMPNQSSSRIAYFHFRDLHIKDEDFTTGPISKKKYLLKELLGELQKNGKIISSDGSIITNSKLYFWVYGESVRNSRYFYDVHISDKKRSNNDEKGLLDSGTLNSPYIAHHDPPPEGTVLYLKRDKNSQPNSEVNIKLYKKNHATSGADKYLMYNKGTKKYVYTDSSVATTFNIKLDKVGIKHFFTTESITVKEVTLRCIAEALAKEYELQNCKLDLDFIDTITFSKSPKPDEKGGTAVATGTHGVDTDPQQNKPQANTHRTSTASKENSRSLPIKIKNPRKNFTIKSIPSDMFELLNKKIRIEGESGKIYSHQIHAENLIIKNLIEEAEISLEENPLFELDDEVEVGGSEVTKEIVVQFKKPTEVKIEIRLDQKYQYINLNDKSLKEDFKDHLSLDPLPEHVYFNPSKIEYAPEKTIINLKLFLYNNTVVDLNLKESTYYQNLQESIRISPSDKSGGIWFSNSITKKIFLKPNLISYQVQVDEVTTNRTRPKIPEYKYIEKNLGKFIRLVNEDNKEVANFSSVSADEVMISFPSIIVKNRLKILNKDELRHIQALTDKVEFDHKNRVIKIPIKLLFNTVKFSPLGANDKNLRGRVTFYALLEDERIGTFQGEFLFLKAANIKYKVFAQYTAPDKYYKNKYIDITEKDITGKPIEIRLPLNTKKCALKPKIINEQERWKDYKPNSYSIRDRNGSVVEYSPDSKWFVVKNAPYTIQVSPADTAGWQITSSNKITSNTIREEAFTFDIKRKTNKKILKVQLDGQLPDSEIPVEISIPTCSYEKRTTLSKSNRYEEFTYDWPRVSRKEEKVQLTIDKPKGFNVNGANWIDKKYKKSFTHGANSEKNITIKLEQLPPNRIVLVDISEDCFDRKIISDKLLSYLNKESESFFVYLSNGATWRYAETRECIPLIKKDIGLGSEVTNFYTDFKKMWSKFQNSQTKSNRKSNQIYLIISGSSFRTIKRNIHYFESVVKSMNLSPKQVHIFSKKSAEIGQFRVESSIKFN